MTHNNTAFYNVYEVHLPKLKHIRKKQIWCCWKSYWERRNKKPFYLFFGKANGGDENKKKWELQPAFLVACGLNLMRALIFDR